MPAARAAGVDVRFGRAYVERLTRLAARGGTLLLAAFARGERRWPAGIDGDEIERRFGSAGRLEASAIEPALSSFPSTRSPSAS